VAIGSSSTAGEADVLPYPSRLEMLLRDRFHDRMIDVLNRLRSISRAVEAAGAT